MILTTGVPTQTFAEKKCKPCEVEDGCFYPQAPFAPKSKDGKPAEPVTSCIDPTNPPEATDGIPKPPPGVKSLAYCVLKYLGGFENCYAKPTTNPSQLEVQLGDMIIMKPDPNSQPGVYRVGGDQDPRLWYAEDDPDLNGLKGNDGWHWHFYHVGTDGGQSNYRVPTRVWRYSGVAACSIQIGDRLEGQFPPSMLVGTADPAGNKMLSITDDSYYFNPVCSYVRDGDDVVLYVGGVEYSRAENEPYGPDDPNGPEGSTQSTTITVTSGGTTRVVSQTHYIRYTTNDNGGSIGKPKYIFGRASYLRMKADGKDPFTSSENDIAEYADQKVIYETDGTIKEIYGGNCEVCSF